MIKYNTYNRNCLRLSLFCFAAATGLLFIIFMYGCGSVGTIKSQINDLTFQQENLPVRTIRVAIANDNSREEQEINALLQEASNSLREQVGIELNRVMTKPIKWSTRTPEGMVEDMRKNFSTLEKRQFDIAIASVTYTASDKGLQLLGLILPIPVWDGCIDSTYRRYIVIKKLDKNILLHEIFHSLIFSEDHDTGGVMHAVQIQIVPGVPLNITEYLTPEDRKESLKNKWRNFNQIARSN
ncbi:MAG: hypothetical protein OEZ31_09900 [Nitrospirota bacterium]|nr:hypothetical protein [Nitrospirota bacterium]MDH5769252.1 hypothetical protein [Nitrospirota bacterium]